MQLCVIFLHGTTHFYWDSVVWEIGMWMYPHLKDSRSHEAANYDTREHGTLHCRTLLRGTRMTTLNGLNGSWSHGIMSQNENTENTSSHHATQLQLSWSAGAVAGGGVGVGAAGCCVIIHDCCWLQLPRTAVVVLQPRRRSDPRDGMRKTNSEQFYTYTATVSPRYHRSILLGIANNCRPVDAISKCKFSIIYFDWFTALNCIYHLSTWTSTLASFIWMSQLIFEGI